MYRWRAEAHGAHEAREILKRVLRAEKAMLAAQARVARSTVLAPRTPTEKANPMRYIVLPQFYVQCVEFVCIHGCYLQTKYVLTYARKPCVLSLDLTFLRQRLSLKIYFLVFANQVSQEDMIHVVTVATGSEMGSTIGASDEDNESIASRESDSRMEMIKQRDQKWKINVFLTRVAQGDEQNVSRMLNSGDVHVAVTDELKRTPLHVAASEGCNSIVRMLLQAKADVSAVDAMLNTPLNDAVQHKHDQAAVLIREHCPTQKYELPGAGAGVEMCVAAAAGDIEQIQRLIRNGVDPDAADYDGRTALHLATCQGQTEVISYLLNVKCNITCKDRFGGTPLEDAVRHHFDLPNATQVQTILRDHGGSLMQSNTNYTIRMCSAAWAGNLDLIKVLAENQADVGLGDYDGRTPLLLNTSYDKNQSR